MPTRLTHYLPHWITLLMLLCSTVASAAPATPYAFTAPIENAKLKPLSWQQQPVLHAPEAGQVELTISLDQQQYPALLPLIKRFAEQEGIKIAVNDGTCGISAGLLSLKQIDIGGFCCPPSESDRLPGLHFHTLGISSLALFTHKDNPIDSITLEQARRLYQGEIEQWSELPAINSSPYPAQPISRLHCKQRPGHWRLLLNNENEFGPLLLDVGAIPDMIAQTAAAPGAIGYETLWMVDHYKHLGELHLLKIDGYSPRDNQALTAGHYPLYRTFNLTTWQGAAANPLANKLVAYLLQEVENLDPKYALLPASQLRKQGWQFQQNELIGPPPTVDH